MAEEQLSGNPFHPGAGFVPEHLAGRKPEQTSLRYALRAITGPRKKGYGPLRGRAPQPLKIVGARGMGKMALLDWARREAEARGADFARLTHEPNADSDDALSALLHKLADIPGLDRKQISEWESDYLQWALDWRPGKPELDFERVLGTRLRFRPLMLVLDDILHYDMDMLDLVLNQYQLLASSGWPLALVLVGTPALDWHLVNVKAAFIYRSDDIYIHCLEPAATREALSKPFADRGVAVSDEALDLMASWTDDYPFFIQAVGSEVWKAKEAKERTEVDVALVQGVEQAVHGERDGFYGKIYDIIDTANLKEYAMKAVAAMEADLEPLTPAQVRDRMAEGTGLKHEDAVEVYSQLLDAGLFWEFEGRGVHTAIPSFFAYFKERYKQERT